MEQSIFGNACQCLESLSASSCMRTPSLALQYSCTPALKSLHFPLCGCQCKQTNSPSLFPEWVTSNVHTHTHTQKNVCTGLHEWRRTGRSCMHGHTSRYGQTDRHGGGGVAGSHRVPVWPGLIKSTREEIIISSYSAVAPWPSATR